MIELANGLDRLLQLLIITQPAAYLGNPLATNAELTCASARIGHRQHKNLVAFAARAFRAAPGVSDSALQQRPPQQLTGDRQLADPLLARSQGLLLNHS
jgi:hypothetical protein